jgi:hypothetical protein
MHFSRDMVIYISDFTKIKLFNNLVWKYIKLFFLKKVKAESYFNSLGIINEVNEWGQ